MPYGVTFHTVTADGGRGPQLGPDAGARPAFQTLGLRVERALRGSTLQKVGEHFTLALHADLATTQEVIIAGE